MPPDLNSLRKAFLPASIQISQAYLLENQGSTLRFGFKETGTGLHGFVVTYFSGSELVTLAIPCEYPGESLLGFIVHRKGKPILVPIQSITLSRTNGVRNVSQLPATSRQTYPNDFLVVTLLSDQAVQPGDSGAALVYLGSEYPIVLGFLEGQFVHPLVGHGMFDHRKYIIRIVCSYHDQHRQPSRTTRGSCYGG
jgi:hypothetical protein